MRRGLRIPMLVKFLIGCFTLAALLIIGGTFVVQSETRLRSRGNYLSKHVRRFLGYQERVGKGMTGTLEILASDAELQYAMVGVRPPPPGGEAGAMPHRGEATAVGGEPVAAQIARSMYEQLVSNNGLRPDLFVLFSDDNKLVWAPKDSAISASELPELAPVEKARGGSVFAHRVVLVDGQPYQVSAMPVRSPSDDHVVGGLLMGVRLQRYFDEFAEQSDDDPRMALRAVVVIGPEVVAAAFPREQWPELGRALAPDKYVRVAMGEDVRDVVRVNTGTTTLDHDFYVEPLEGWKGLENAAVGKLFMLRSRATLVDPGSKIPWLEIAIGGLLSVVIASLLALWITRPIKQFVRQSRKLLEGETDLTQRIEVRSNDETADLAENINQVFARLQRLASEVQTAAFQVGASSAEISAASKQMLAGLKDQTLKIEGSTAAVTELSASIQTVAGNAGQATSVAERSNVAVTSAVQRMQQIRDSVDEAAGRMRELGESSKRIGNIVEVIRQISEQTSLLALNASIEAAHAGEQGRGFAVVADEVSSLARRVGQSAKDIEVLIQTIKEQTQAATASMDLGTRDVENGTQLVTNTLTDLGQLISVVKDTAQAVGEQAVVSDEIARNMDAVQRIAGDVLHGSEESVVQAERLHELAYALEESIGGFNLDGSGKLRPASERARAGDGGRERALPSGERGGNSGAGASRDRRDRSGLDRG